MEERKAAVHILADNRWKALPTEPPKTIAEFDSGGGGLFSNGDRLRAVHSDDSVRRQA